jgi:hypothetical protein
MDTLTLKSISDLLQTGGVLGALILFIWLLLAKKIVLGWQYVELQKRERMWQQLALEGTKLGERSTRIAEKALTGIVSPLDGEDIV